MSDSDHLTDEQFEQRLKESVAALESLLAIPPGFFTELLMADDWSFVVKLHALVESALTRLLEVAIAPDLPLEFLVSLDLSGGRHSKLQLLRLLGLIDSDGMKFVRGLSKIRNRLVHNVTHVGFIIKDYVGTLDADQTNQFALELCHLFYCDSLSSTERLARKSDILENPKSYVWRSALFYLAVISMKIDTASLKMEVETLKRQSLEQDAKTARELSERLKSNLLLEAYERALRKPLPSSPG